MAQRADQAPFSPLTSLNHTSIHPDLRTLQRMPDKKRPTSAKQSAHSKRHKASGGGSKAKKGGAYPSATDAAADRAAKAAKSLAKKDRKGKGPAFIPVPEARGAGGEDSSSGEGSEEDEGMDVDPELLEGEGVDFLTKLDKKGMSACVGILHFRRPVYAEDELTASSPPPAVSSPFARTVLARRWPKRTRTTSLRLPREPSRPTRTSRSTPRRRPSRSSRRQRSATLSARSGSRRARTATSRTTAPTTSTRRWRRGAGQGGRRVGRQAAPGWRARRRPRVGRFCVWQWRRRRPGRAELHERVERRGRRAGD